MKIELEQFKYAQKRITNNMSTLKLYIHVCFFNSEPQGQLVRSSWFFTMMDFCLLDFRNVSEGQKVYFQRIIMK